MWFLFCKWAFLGYNTIQYNNFSLIRNKHIFEPIKILLNSSNQSPFYSSNVAYSQAVWCILIYLSSDGVKRHLLKTKRLFLWIVEPLVRPFVWFWDSFGGVISVPCLFRVICIHCSCWSLQVKSRSSLFCEDLDT